VYKHDQSNSHRLTPRAQHGFDSLGRQYNSKGIFGTWWDHDALNNLDSQNQCLVSQYNAYGVDGQGTLNNNFADCAGLSIVESLWINKTDQMMILPGLNEWTKHQLSYIQFARMKCSKSTKEHQVCERVFFSNLY
jgi:predicted metalloendopeptidase